MFSQSCCASMLYVFHVICILQQSSRLLCLEIDNRLTHPVNDCYSRISIGSKLPDEDIALQTDVTSLTECEENCSKYRNGCAAFSFGVGIKGNSTCLISLRIPALEYLRVHPEYDVYVKNPENSLWCDFDHYYGSLTRNSKDTVVNKISENGPITSTGEPSSKSVAERTSVSVQRYTLLSSSHDKRTLPGDHRHKPLGIVSVKAGRTTPTRSFAVDCHRKMQPGKKMMEPLVERIVSCENVQDCCRWCDYERSFVCKGFNHRHRTGDPKCTCELTSTPYFRMNVDEDFLVDTRYDYYEKNQNCLPPTRHGNGLSRWRNRMKYYGQGDRDAWLGFRRMNKDSFRQSSTITNRVYARDYYSNGHVQSSDPINYEEPFGLTSRHDTLNLNRSWKGSTPRYSGIVSDNRAPYHHGNYEKGFLESRLNNEEHFHGKVYAYAGAYDQRSDYEQPPSRCSVKAVPGARLSRGVLRKTYLAHDFGQCEHFCIGETSFSCESFAYRYDVLTTSPVDNCLLSDRSYRDLNFYTDLEPDRDYDSYVTMLDAKTCYFKTPTNRYPSEECFSRIRSGFTIPMAITKKSLFANDLGECQFACTRSQEFICKCFVYKYKVPVRGSNHEGVSSNCFLSDWPAEEINPIDMPDMDGAELYERATFSYGCNVYSLPSPVPNDISRNHGGFSSVHMDELCYSEHHIPCRLMSHAIVSSMRAVTKYECRQRCSAMRNAGTIPCMSFDYANDTASFTTDTDGTRDNCFLSDISIRDLRPNLDYVHDNHHTLYTWTDYDPRCSFNAPDTTNATPSFEKHGSPDPSTPWKDEFGPEEYDERYVKYSSINENGTPLADFGAHGHEEEEEHNVFYPGSQSSSSRRYTVNGHPCKNGTVCQENKVSGFWSCEIENEYGTWDYCCEPNHRCGYSNGYHHLWCYVGSTEDQWRPCSDTYHPYYLSKDRRADRGSALHAGHHWPVIYVHEIPPPNCSTNDPHRMVS